jgi:hypothetical protein
MRARWFALVRLFPIISTRLPASKAGGRPAGISGVSTAVEP